MQNAERQERSKVLGRQHGVEADHWDARCTASGHTDALEVAAQAIANVCRCVAQPQRPCMFPTFQREGSAPPSPVCDATQHIDQLGRSWQPSAMRSCNKHQPLEAHGDDWRKCGAEMWLNRHESGPDLHMPIYLTLPTHLFSRQNAPASRVPMMINGANAMYSRVLRRPVKMQTRQWIGIRLITKL